MTDSKLPDNQAGYEKGISVALAALAGCNNVSESSGMVGSLMGLSLEALVIENVVHGEGHYLRHPQTMELMHSEYEYPRLADRSAPNDWERAGSPDIRKRAAEGVRKVLSSHYPEYVDRVIDKKIRNRFPIMLDSKEMQAGNGRW